MPDTTDDADGHPYVTGTPHPNTKGWATFETKPPNRDRHGRRDSGAGYERWRSTEHRPHTARDGKEDVYVSHHRLLSVIACFGEQDEHGEYVTPISEVLRELDGRDVHHATGVEWVNAYADDDSNFEEFLQLRGHGEHSGVTNAVTNAKRRAWAETAKEQMAQDTLERETCDGCGDAADVLTRSPDWDGLRCIACSQRESDGATIEVAE